MPKVFEEVEEKITVVKKKEPKTETLILEGLEEWETLEDDVEAFISSLYDDVKWEKDEE